MEASPRPPRHHTDVRMIYHLESIGPLVFVRLDRVPVPSSERECHDEPYSPKNAAVYPSQPFGHVPARVKSTKQCHRDQNHGDTIALKEPIQKRSFLSSSREGYAGKYPYQLRHSASSPDSVQARLAQLLNLQRHGMRLGQHWSRVNPT